MMMTNTVTSQIMKRILIQREAPKAMMKAIRRTRYIEDQ